MDFHFRDKAILFYHHQMWDQLSHCVCYYECLQSIKKWSDQNPDHFPLYIIFEPKAKKGPIGEGTVIHVPCIKDFRRLGEGPRANTEESVTA